MFHPLYDFLMDFCVFVEVANRPGSAKKLVSQVLGECEFTGLALGS